MTPADKIRALQLGFPIGGAAHTALEKAAALAATSEFSGLRVKPLAWEDMLPNHARAAAPLFGNIRVESWGGPFRTSWSVPGYCDEFCPGEWLTIAEAKAAAQREYEARLLGALQDIQPPRVKHIKRGTTYRMLCEAKVQTDVPLTDDAAVVVYQGEADGMVWVRPVAEFRDPARFLQLGGENG